MRRHNLIANVFATGVASLALATACFGATPGSLVRKMTFVEPLSRPAKLFFWPIPSRAEADEPLVERESRRRALAIAFAKLDVKKAAADFTNARAKEHSVAVMLQLARAELEASHSHRHLVETEAAVGLLSMEDAELEIQQATSDERTKEAAVPIAEAEVEEAKAQTLEAQSNLKLAQSWLNALNKNDESGIKELDAAQQALAEAKLEVLKATSQVEAARCAQTEVELSCANEWCRLCKQSLERDKTRFAKGEIAEEEVDDAEAAYRAAQGTNRAAAFSLTAFKGAKASIADSISKAQKELDASKREQAKNK